MHKILDITRKDLLQMLRDWKFLFFLLIMPAAFTLLMGFVFGGAYQTDTDARSLVALVDQDQSNLSEAFLGVLETSDTIRIELRDTIEDLDEGVEDAELAAGLVLPQGFGVSLMAGDPVDLDLTVDPDSGASQTARNEIQALASRFTGAVRTARFSLQVYQESAVSLSETDVQEFFDAALGAALQAWQDPPVKLEITDAVLVKDDPVDQAYGSSPYAHSSPGMMAQFAIAGLIPAASVLVIERKTRALARMLTTATSRGQILAGHFLTMFLMILAQFLILTLFGQLLLDLDYYTPPWATLVMIFVTALFIASLGMLIATLAKTEEHVIVFTMLPMFVLSALGGAWMALEVMPASMQTIGHFSPVAWIMDGFKGILVRGWGVEQVLLPAGVLLLFTLVCLGFSLWKFRFE
ncbi:MAG TPA: ABC transporter permease [Anaerolineales bacterium]|nr:ABC transporter permease [Anaerolineales bacterium]